jgi:predicted nucleic acid-binding protein
MAKQIVLLDTSILIDFFRKSHKEKSKWFELIKAGNEFAISVVTEYEILIGSNDEQLEYWRTIFNQIKVLPLDSTVINSAVEIHSTLKKKRKQIDVADLFIAATAVRHNMPIATLNKSHFERIETLKIHK